MEPPISGQYIQQSVDRPRKSDSFENAKEGAAYVLDSKLKVMLEGDYLSLKNMKDQV